MPYPIIWIGQNSQYYPNNQVDLLSNQAPAKLAVIGVPERLSLPWLALFCSSKCPGSLIIKAYNLSPALQGTKIALAGGFHSPVEKDALRVALRGSQQLLICPARGLEGMRIPETYRKPLDDGRLIFISPFSEKIKRPTQQTSIERNRLVAALSERVLVIHAELDSKLTLLCQEVLSWGKPIYTLNDPTNDHLVSMGVKIFHLDDFV